MGRSTATDRKSTRLNSSHLVISYAVFCLKKKKLGVAMDSVEPLFTPGTRLLKFDSDAEALARLINDWRLARPEYLKGVICYFFFNDTATTEIYTLSLHDALPI